MRKNDGVPAGPTRALLTCVGISLVLAALEPVPGGRHYEYALILSLALTALWFLSAARPDTFFGKRVLTLVLLAGLVLGAVNLAVVRSDSEIVRAYGTVFEALEAGRNPYTSGTIYHEIESLGPVLGNFNYPPLEIYPYYLAYKIAGAWNIRVLVATMVLIQAFCGLVLFRMFPRIRPVLLLPFMPLILLGEIKTNVALTFLVAVLILWAIKRQAEAPRPHRRFVIAVLFGLGAMTKFLILPLMAAYYVHQTDARDLRSIVRTGLDVGIAAAAALLVMAPFGVAEVFKNTALFNIVLEDRAVLTTFYPNVLSGPLAWFGLSWLYPFAAFALVALVIGAARRLALLPALLAASFAFMIAASTPEPQFIPVLLFMVVVGQGMALGRNAKALDMPEEFTPAGESGGVGEPRGSGRSAAARKRAVAAGLMIFLFAASSTARGSIPPSSRSAADQAAAPASVPMATPSSLDRPMRVPFSLAPARSDRSPAKPKGKRLRAWLELAAFSVATTAIYWTGDSFPEDRDFKIDVDDQISRIVFLDGWRFDSNQFSLNWFHIMAGAAYYQFGRSSQMSWLYSWMMAIAGSTWWEVVGEPKEVIAINDQVMTGLGGFAVGEPWYRIGHFLCHQRGPVQRALGFLNPAVKLNHWLDRKDPAAEDFVPPGWHEFRLSVGARRLSADGSSSGTDLTFGLEARLIDLPEYGQPGRVRRAVRDPYVSEITVDYATRGGHAEETRFQTRAVTWGRFVQKIDAGGDGTSLTLGLGSSFEFFKKRPLADYDANPVPVKTDLARLRLDEPRRFTDKLALLHVAGPVLDLTVFRRGLKLRTVVEAYLDFGLVNASALNDFSLSNDISGLKTTVFYYGYYYGLGGTLSIGARLDWRGFRVRGLASFGAWRSIDQLDRFQAEVTNNTSLRDTRVRLLAGVGWRVPGTAFEAFAEIEEVRRRGRIAAFAAGGRETKIYAGVAFTF
jgi:hypothetical protein